MCLPSRCLVSPLPPNVSPWFSTCLLVLDGASACLTSCPPWPPIVYHCLPTCVPVLDGVPAFLTSCLPFSPIKPIVSHCLPTHVPVLDGGSALSTSCLPFLFPIVSPHVCLCWMVSCLVCLCWVVRPPSRRLISPFCLPLSPCMFWMVCMPSRGLVSPCLPVLDGVSTFPSSCLPLSPIEPIASHCLPLFAHTCACVGWCDRLPDVLFPLFFLPLLPTCVPVMVCLPSLVSPWPAIVSHCLPLHAPAFPSSVPPCLPLSPTVCHCLPLSPHKMRLCWMVRPPSQGLVSPCRLPLSPISLLVSRSWMVCPPSRGLVSSAHCSGFSPIVSPHVCLCWMVCPPSRSLISYCLPTWSVRLPDVLSPNCLPLPPHACVPVLDGMSAFPRSCFPSSPFLSILVSGCLELFPIVSNCLPLSPHMCACVGWCLRLGWCVRLPAILSPRVCLCWMVRLLSRRSCLPVLFPIVSFLGSLCWMVCLPSRGFVPLVSQLVAQLVFLLVSLCGGWSDSAFFFMQCTVRGSYGFLKVSALVLDGVSAFPRSCLLSCLPACLSSCFRLWRMVSFCIFSQTVCG